MPITKIDNRDFSQATTTTYNVDDIYGQIATLQQQIAQQTSNAMVALQNELAPLQAQITDLQSLLTAAAAQGVDTTPPAGQPDVTPVTDAIASLNTSALAVASPQAAQAPLSTAASQTATSSPPTQ